MIETLTLWEMSTTWSSVGQIRLNKICFKHTQLTLSEYKDKINDFVYFPEKRNASIAFKNIQK